MAHERLYIEDDYTNEKQNGNDRNSVWTPYCDQGQWKEK